MGSVPSIRFLPKMSPSSSTSTGSQTANENIGGHLTPLHQCCQIARELEDKRRVCCRVSVVKLHGSLRARGGYVVESMLSNCTGA